MTRLLSWYRKDDEKCSTYGCSKDTPEAIASMRAKGFIPMEERICQLLAEHKAKDGPRT